MVRARCLGHLSNDRNIHQPSTAGCRFSCLSIRRYRFSVPLFDRPTAQHARSFFVLADGLVTASHPHLLWVRMACDECEHASPYRGFPPVLCSVTSKPCHCLPHGGNKPVLYPWFWSQDAGDVPQPERALSCFGDRCCISLRASTDRERAFCSLDACHNSCALSCSHMDDLYAGSLVSGFCHLFCSFVASQKATGPHSANVDFFNGFAVFSGSIVCKDERQIDG